MIDKISFLSDCIKYPHHAEILSAIAANSNYLTDILVRNPEIMYRIFSPGYLSEPITEQSLAKEINAGLKNFRNTESKFRYLRATKRRYLLKIALNDILENTTLTEITAQLSLLAVALNRSLFELCYDSVLESSGIQPPNKKYCLMSLGKLGGNELNYSSDIDLLLIYDSNEPVGNTRKVEFHEILTKTTEMFVAKATEFTELGNLYRVDFRLRPDGAIAPLCRTLLDTMNYYESRGEQWERQMLIKLNFLAGDADLYKDFQSFVSAYIYQGTMKISPLAAIKEMKSAIEKHHPGDENIKTFIGGIRDIEFTVQALQLMNGNRLKELRTSTTLIGIEKLTEYKLLTQDEGKSLSDAYRFYRRIEHYLQLMNNTQTHAIPENEDMRISLTIFMKCKNQAEFNKTLSTYRKKVRTIYNTILGEKSSGTNTSITQPVKFDNDNRAKKDLQFLELGSGIIATKNFESKTTRLFQNIRPVLFKLLTEVTNPGHVLENLVKLVRSYSLTTILYEEFQNEKFFREIIRICERSDYAINLLINHPQLVEDLISRTVFTKNLPDVKDAFNFSRFKFSLSVQYTLNLIDHRKVSEFLTGYISNVIDKNFTQLFSNYEVFIAGMGSFGAIEMTFHSDLDLIIVIDDINKHPEIHDISQRFLAKIQKHLHPLEIDFRLRPEGKSSPLVWDIKNYKIYLGSRAGLWEFQSLLKIRKISGNDGLFQEFVKIVVSGINSFDKSRIKKDIAEMHKKVTSQALSAQFRNIELKRNPGGLTTIDYFLSFLQMADKQLVKLSGQQLFSKKLLLSKLSKTTEHVSTIKSNYKFLKETEFILQNSFEQRKAVIPQDSIKQKLLAKFLKEKDYSSFETKLLKILRTNLSIFNSIIN